MIATTYADEPLYLWPWPPNWADAVKSEHELPGRIEAGLSDREAGYPTGETLRTRLRFTADLFGCAEVAAVANALRELTTERVAMPFWPAARPTAEYADASIHGGLNISYQVDELGWPDFLRWEIHAGLAPSGGYGADEQTMTAPLLLGYLSDPGGAAESDEVWSFDVDFSEDSDATLALQIAAFTEADGPTLPGSAPKLFPLRHDWTSVPKQSSRIALERKRIGQGRRFQVVHHGAASRVELGLKTTFLNATEAARVLRFFADHRGTAGAFWTPGSLAATRLTADVDAADTLLQVEDGTALGGHGWLALLSREALTPAAVTGQSASQISLSAPVGQDFLEAETSLCPLLLTRFDRRLLQITWETDEVGEIAVDLVETPPAYGPPESEVLGAQPRLASLYTFKSGGLTWRYTDWERALTLAGNTYQTAHLEHGDITQTLDLTDTTSLTGDRSVAPLHLAFLGQLGIVALTIDLAEASGGTASNPRRVFTGELRRPKATGPTLKASCGLWRALDNLVPRARFAEVCQWPLYGAGCTLLLADWIFTAELTDVGTPGYPYAFTVGSLARQNGAALPAGFGSTNWFAWGFAEFPSGERIRIQQSTALSSGQLVLTLARDPSPFPEVGQTLKLVRGCDGQRSTCTSVFDNWLNWGGAMNASANLSLVRAEVPTNNSGAKK